MIRGSPRTPDRLPELSGSHVQQSEVLRTMIGACGPYNLGGSATLHYVKNVYVFTESNFMYAHIFIYIFNNHYIWSSKVVTKFFY